MSRRLVAGARPATIAAALLRRDTLRIHVGIDDDDLPAAHGFTDDRSMLWRYRLVAEGRIPAVRISSGAIRVPAGARSRLADHGADPSL